jgi:hypothetical protein
VKKNLGKSDAAASEFGAIMISKSPASIQEEAKALDARRVAAFKKGVAAFENSTGGEDQADAADDSD